MGSAYPELHEQRETIEMWLRNEEEAFNRTLEQGMRLLDDVIARARDAGEEGIGADQAFLLHDTYGFPFDLTLELAAEQGLGVDEQGFESLMDEQRTRARSAGRGARDERARADPRVRRGGGRADDVHGLRADRAGDGGRRGVARENGRVLLKLVESPFYATGGGQVADAGVVECEDGDCRARVVDVVRRRRRPGARARARGGRAARGRARRRARRSRAPAPDRVQPHRDAPAPRGAARDARRRTCARPAPTSARTSCASTSPTASR